MQSVTYLGDRTNFLVKNFDSWSLKSIFDTKNQEYVNYTYFLESCDKIRFFLKTKLSMKKVD